MRIALALLFAVSLSFAEDVTPWPAIKAGEFWYRSTDGNGKTDGYMHLFVERTKDDGLKGSWELKIAPGGKDYVDSRMMEITKDLSLVAASIAIENGASWEIHTSGGILVGKGSPGPGSKEEEVSIDEGAKTASTLTSLLALTMPRDKDAKPLTITEISLQGRQPAVMGKWSEVRPDGPETLDWEGSKLETWKYTIARDDGPSTNVWVTNEGTIAQIESSGSRHLTLSSKPTRDLFKEPPPSVLKDISKDFTSITLQGDFPGFTPAEMFDYHTKPDLITKWWAPKAEVGDKVGGVHVLDWPDMKWTLRGEITAWEPGKKFGFTWKWDHEAKEKQPLKVTLDFAALPAGGTQMTITHGPYAENADGKKEREGHIAGWKVFCDKLKTLKK